MRLGTSKRGDHVPRFMVGRVVAALTAVVLVVTACGEDSGGGGGGTTDNLKLYNDKGAWEQFFREVGQLSQQEIGLSMEPVGYTDEPTYEAFIKASFRTNVKPDLFTWTTGHRMQEIVAEGVIADTTELWDRAIANGDLTESLRPYYTIDGRQYCVPLNVAYWVMFYNKHVFDEHGLEPPTTWDELMQIAETLQDNGVTPFYHTSVLFSFVWFQQLLVGSDPALYEALSNGTASYTDPGVVAVMEEWKQMIDNGYFSDPGDQTDPAAQLKSGDVAMGNWGTWFNTSMTQQEMVPGEDYGMFFIPNRNPQAGQTALLFESGPLCMLDDAPYREESMRYLEWWVGPSAQELWANSRGDVSGNPKVQIPDPGLNEITQAAGTADYKLYNRYFEATPAPVLTAALDAFGAFVVNPEEYQSQLETIQQAADDYWAQAGGRRRGGGAGASGYGFVAPAVLLVAALLYAPFLWTLYLGFHEYGGLRPAEFVGLDNFTRLFDDPALVTSVRNTLMWAVGATLVPVALGLLVAVLSYGIRGGIWYRIPFLLPYALSGAGLAVIWGFILQSGGAFNRVLDALGLPGAQTRFLLEDPQNTIVMIMAFTWQQVGVNALLFLVGLQSIPREPVEAARLDGATGWRLFRHVTWPLLTPLTTVVVGLSLVASLKTFDIVWVMTQGGPGRSSETLAVTMYRNAFVTHEYGYGSAVALALTVVTGAISFAYLRRQLSTRRAPS